jgi:hypothetical protein
MKISKRQLRRIIKEEKAKIIKEYYPIGGDAPSPSWKAFQDAAYAAAAEKIEAGMEADGIMDAMKDDVEQMINDIESEWLDDDPGYNNDQGR